MGMFFFPQNELRRNQAKKMFEIIAAKEGLNILGWREVPHNTNAIGQRAVDCMPNIQQCFIERPEGVRKGLDFDRRLYVARRIFEQSSEDTYVVSLSSRTIVYKGMFLVGDLRNFFPDLQDMAFESAIALVHSRFSTNTNPSWQRAHPNRMIVHNGEINTIKGNADKMLAREETMRSGAPKGRFGQGNSRGQRRGLQLRNARQHARIPRDERYGFAPCGDDNNSRAVGQKQHDLAQERRIFTSITRQ